MSRCASCSADITPESGFCARCGTPQGAGAEDGNRPTATFGAVLRTSSSDSEGRFPPGTMLAGRYRVVGRLGRGGMGEVYRADDMKLGQPVALKFLPKELQARESTLARFHHEVRIARQVSHPNVCRVYDIAETEGQHFLSMEYVDGEDLRSLLRRIGRLPGDKAVQIARQLCAGLAAAHEKGVLHRDLKPANVMLDGEGRVRITDFGLAAIAGEIQASDVRSGTPAYMAPEQLAGRDVSVASDLYALGLVLFEVFTGKPAFRAGSLDELLRLQQSDVTAPSSVVDGLDPAVERVILACLARHPAERPSSALAVAAALPGGDPLAAALAAGETPSPEMVAASGVAGGMRPWAAWTAIAVVLAGLAVQALIGSRASIAACVPLDKEPQVLIAEARRVLATVGHTEPPADFLWGFARNDAYVDHLAKLENPRRWDALGRGHRAGVLFFYRQSPRALVPLDPMSNRMDLADPPATLPGTATVWLDTDGQLVRLEVLPPERVEPVAGAVVDTDWSPLLSAAGLDAAGLTSVPPSWNAPFETDRQVAWDGSDLRVEAASHRGRPLFFRVLGSWDEPFRDAEEPAGRAGTLAGALLFAVFLGIFGGGFLLARRNLRLGRSDRRGAFRVAAVFTTLHMLAWLLYSKHPGGADALVNGLWASLAQSLIEALYVYTLYLALEPFIRRRWPDTIVSWTRVLAGRFKDPLVGRDVLLGCALVSALTLLGPLLEAVRSGVGLAPPEPWPISLSALAGNRFLLGELVDLQVHVIGPTMGMLILLLFVSMLTRRAWLAGMVVVGLFAGTYAFAAPDWLSVLDPVVYLSVVLLCLTRLGLLSTIVVWGLGALFGNLLFTADLGAWYGTGALLTVLWTVALAVWGFWLALAGRPVLGSGWLQD